MKPLNIAIAVIAALLVAILVSSASAQPFPQLSDDQARVLEAVRAAALKYSRQLPDFICTQITHRDVSRGNSSYLNAKNVAPRPQPVSNDTIEEQLTYYGGKESYSVVSVNHKKARDANHLQFAGAMSSGEFGTIFINVFDPASGTTFAFDKEITYSGRRAWGFRFHVPKEAGTRLVDKATNRGIVAGYSGTVLVDPDNDIVLEIFSKLEIPDDFPIRVVQRRIDYSDQTIADKRYCLPIHSELHMEQGYLTYDNRIDFKDYHHFSTESTVHYGSEAK